MASADTAVPHAPPPRTPIPVRTEPHLPRWLPAQGHRASPSPEQDPLRTDGGWTAGLSQALQRLPPSLHQGQTCITIWHGGSALPPAPASSALTARCSVMQSCPCYPLLASALQGPDTRHVLPAQHHSACFTRPTPFTAADHYPSLHRQETRHRAVQ